MQGFASNSASTATYLVCFFVFFLPVAQNIVLERIYVF